MRIRTFHGLNGDVLSETTASAFKFRIKDATELACKVNHLVIRIKLHVERFILRASSYNLSTFFHISLVFTMKTTTN